MACLNRVELIGNLGADPEAKSLNSGGEVVNLRLACTEKWKDRDGNQKERTEWVTVVIWNEGLAKVAKQYLRKGSRCYIAGKLQTRKWQDQSGADRYSTEVMLQQYHGELILLDGRDSTERGSTQQQSTGGGGRGNAGRADPFGDDDAPFIRPDDGPARRVM